MNHTHTPGPWSIHGDNAHLIGAEDTKAMIAEIIQPLECHPPKWRRSVAECNYNACLIVAAPDLLRALLLFVEQYQGNGYDERETRPEMIAARAAIRKATTGN
jgi:hypothetical protein